MNTIIKLTIRTVGCCARQGDKFSYSARLYRTLIFFQQRQLSRWADILKAGDARLILPWIEFKKSF